MKKTLPIQNKTLESEQIEQFFKTVVYSIDDVIEASTELIIENEDKNTEKIINHGLLSDNLQQEVITPVDKEEVSPLFKEKQESPVTSEKEESPEKFKKFFHDVFFQTMGKEKLGNVIWDKRAEGKREQKELVKNTQEEVNDKEIKEEQKESPVILEDINVETSQQTPLLDKILETNIVNDETRYEEAAKWEKEIGLLEDIKDILLGQSRVDKVEEESPVSSNSSGLVSGMMGGMMAGMLGNIKKGLLSAFKLLFSPKALLKVVSKVFAPVAIIATIGKGIMDGFKEFQESGSIKDALIAGIGGMLEFITFGLFDKEKLTEVIDYMSGFVNDYIMGPLNTFMEWIGESFNTYIKEPILGAFDWYIDKVKTYYLDPIMSVFDTFSGVIGKITGSITGFLHNIEIPGISFTIPGIGKKIQIGPFYPFAKDDSGPASVEDDVPKVKSVDTRTGYAGDQTEAFSDQDPSQPLVKDNDKNSFSETTTEKYTTNKTTNQREIESLMEKRSFQENTNNVTKISEARIENLTLTHSSENIEMAKNIGANIKVNVPAQQQAPAAPQKNEVMKPPFSSRIKNDDATVGRYIDKGYGTW